MSQTARAFLAATGLVAVVGIVVGLWNGYTTGLAPFPGAGFSTRYSPGWPGLVIQLAFFTLWSNVILGTTCLLLAKSPERTSNVFHSFRLAGLGMIIITFLVTQGFLVPNGTVHLTGIAAVADLLLHKMSPIMAMIGWLFVGPRRSITLYRIVMATLIPLAYTVITLIRGATDNWYPYPILDVARYGYRPVLINSLIITAATVVIYGTLSLLDVCIVRGRARSSHGPDPF